ncbi:MAG: reverse transcriptase-like protein [Candidatus Saccharimonadales bacterium]
MKTLKLEHKLADMVRAGAKTSTWRLYDDKDIKVNDRVEFIDKVEAGNPDSWKSVGVALIDVVVEKRLGELSEEDFVGHEPFASKEEMLSTYQGYYGPQVTLDTPIKMIHFTLQKVSDSQDGGAQVASPKLKEAKLYADGGSRGNPGPSASGFAVVDMDGNIVVKKGVYLGVTTNNQAEYQALRLGLKEAQGMGVRVVHVFLDSMLVVNQMKGIFQVKNRDLWPIYESIKQMLPNFQQVTFTHIPRELNKVADGAVNDALDHAATIQ